MSPSGPSRRNVLRFCLASALANSMRAAEKSRIAVARDPALRPASGGAVDSARLLKALDRAIQATYATDSPLEAWKRVVKPGETVGLKVNCLSGRGSSSSPVFVEAICERLQQAGVPHPNIVVWDRLNDDLDRAGFQVSTRKDRVRFIGNDVSGYETDLAVFGSAGSLISRTLTQVCDCVINVPVLKDHGIVGVTMALKNMFGAIHNPNKYHINGGDPYVADVNALAPVRRKLRLTICEAIAPQYEGGPSYMPHWQWPFNGVLVSRDPVALDYTGWQIIEEQRAARGLPSLKAAKREPTYIARAADAQHRLGTNDPRMIERVEA